MFTLTPRYGHGTVFFSTRQQVAIINLYTECGKSLQSKFTCHLGDTNDHLFIVSVEIVSIPYSDSGRSGYL